jgi:membrane associated rhomboid family serine protease
VLTPSVTVVGASGAVMGVLVAFAMLNPDRQLFMLPFPLPITARALVIVILAINVMSALSEGTASVLTHLGGMGAAWLYMKFIHSWTPEASHYAGKKDWPFGDEPDDFKASEKSGGGDEFLDRVGEAVDNILKFDEKKKR